MSDARVEVAFDVDAELGEGALWDWRHDRLVSVDIPTGRVLISDPGSGTTRTIEVGQPVSAAMLQDDDQLLLAVRDGFVSLDPATRALGDLVPVEADLPANRMNDGACDRRGRCFAGTMALDSTPGAGSLYRLDPDLSVHTIFAGVSISNGIGWSPAGDVMYHVDTLAGGIDEYRYDEDAGVPSNKRRLVDTDPAWGVPDGLAMDVQGGIWIAFWNGAAVRRFSPAGDIDETIEVPAKRPTRPAFGGPDLDRLYLTTAKSDATGGDLGGAILVVDAGARGTRADVFRPTRA